MGANDLICELRRKGYSIRADGGYLDISPADNLPPELVQQLKQSKAEILTELRREAGLATSWRWLLHYQNGDFVELSTTPKSTVAEVLRDFPGAVSAEPILDTPR